MLQQSIKHNNSIPRLFTAAALTLGLLLACKKEVVQHYSEHSDKDQQHNSIAFTCIENNSFNTKANTQRNHSADGSISNNNSSLKEVITLSECDSLYLILQEETMSASQARTDLGMDNGMSKDVMVSDSVVRDCDEGRVGKEGEGITKAAPTTTLNSTVGLFAYNHSSATLDAAATQLADNHSINPMGGGTGRVLNL